MTEQRQPAEVQRPDIAGDLQRVTDDPAAARTEAAGVGGYREDPGESHGSQKGDKGTAHDCSYFVPYC
ncbi:hypothetical protein ACH4YO_16755 [Streptomyces noursei]|uniref:hypothetical protein n=1 Tax=Streptomyces noursei TaxID=1971 RepID=UPI00082E48CE